MERFKRLYQDYKSYVGVASLAVAATALVANYFLNVVETPRVYFKEESDSLVCRIIPKLNILRESYYPTFWCVCTFVSLLSLLVAHGIRFDHRGCENSYFPRPSQKKARFLVEFALIP